MRTSLNRYCVLFGFLFTAIHAQAGEIWLYKGRGTETPDATEKTAKVIVKGYSEIHNQWHWSLYDLTPGKYKVTVRMKAKAKPMSGSLAITVRSGFAYAVTPCPDATVAKGGSAELETSFKDFMGEYEHKNDVPLRYAFFYSISDLDTDVLLDSIKLELMETTPLTEVKALKVWHFEGKGTKDPKAEDGEAALLPQMMPQTIARQMPLGKYEMAVRLRRLKEGSDLLEDREDWGVTHNQDEFPAGLNGAECPLPNSFRTDAYTTLRMPFMVTTIAPDLSFLARNQGKPNAINDYLIDWVEFRLVEATNEAQVLAAKNIQRGGQLIAHDGLQVWLGSGLGVKEIGVLSALKNIKAKITEAWLITAHGNPTWGGQVALRAGTERKEAKGTVWDFTRMKDGQFPQDSFEDRLFAYDAAIVTDIPGRLFGIEERGVLVDYVKAGGGLLMIGGMHGLDRGGWQQSDLLAEVLPVSLSQDRSLQKLAKPEPLIAGAGTALVAPDLSADKPMVKWLHKVQPKSGSVVQLTAGGNPVLVTWTIGKGRVAVLAAPPLGERQEKGQLFCTTKSWQQTMDRLLVWLAGNQ